MTRSATFVWKAARERLEAPECPMNMSEPQWAALLLGTLVGFENLGFVTTGASPLTFPAELRCKKRTQARVLPFASGLHHLQESKVRPLFRSASHLISFSSSYLIESKFETRFPNCDPEILELIPHTNG